MPLWPAPLPALPEAPLLPETAPERAAVQRQTMTFGEDLRVEFDRVLVRPGLYEFTGQVVVRYLETTLRTDHLRAWPLESRAECSSARIEDPEAELDCHDLSLNWKEKTASFTRLSLQAGGVTVRASKGSIVQASWTLNDVEGTSSRRKHPTWQAKAKEVRMQPGKGGVARRVVFSFLGLPLGPLPTASFNLDRRVTGLKIPEISNKKGVGLGVAWSSALLVDDRTAAFLSVGAFPRQSLGSSFTLARSSLDPAKQGSAIVPRSDLAVFGDDGWFGNLLVREPGEQASLLRARRDSWSVGTAWNAGTSGRTPDAEDVSKALELAAEHGGEAANLGYLVTARAQRVRPDSATTWHDRLLVDATLGLSDIKLGRDMSLVSRVDFRGTASSGGSYGLGRLESGFAWTPGRGAALGVGASYAASTGRPDFGFDPMPHGTSLSLRGDWKSGPFTLRGLWRYDLVSRVWYDRQYELAVLADGFEPYVVSRDFPSDFRVGLRFRLDQFLPRLLDREVKREKKPTRPRL